VWDLTDSTTEGLLYADFPKTTESTSLNDYGASVRRSLSGGRVKLQVLLHSQHRNPDGLAKVKQASAALGIRPTAQGEATISADVDEHTYKAIFGEEPATQDTSFERGSLPIPESLKEYVQSISIAPTHIYMDRKR
jgi:hypothetical protein